jgi:hypothetical protein
MSRINILKASVKDFALEVVTNLPSGTSHEDGRIVKRLDGSAVKLYMWHAATTEWIEFGNFDDLSSLETRLSVEESSENAAVASMEVIDSSLETRISTEEVARAADVSSEASRAASAEVVLSTNLSAEVSARTSAVASEETRALAAEAVISGNLSSELRSC